MAARLDGNVLAGPLSEVFSADMTAVEARCDSCGDVSVLARAIVEITGHTSTGQTFTIQCHRCGTVMGALSVTRDGNRFDASRMSWLTA